VAQWSCGKHKVDQGIQKDRTNDRYGAVGWAQWVILLKNSSGWFAEKYWIAGG
jgi:hypothetical protein